MAGKARGPYPDIKRELLNRPHGFSFFQVIRLLRLFDTGLKKGKRSPGKRETPITVRPELSLAFPAADVSSIEPTGEDDGGFLVTATFLGLYGTSSPLPTFYTEDLLEEAGEDENVTRDFMDILNGHLYRLLFRCWTKYRLSLQVVEEEDARQTQRLFCLLGLGSEKLRKELPESYRFLRYLGLVIQHPRSALGLKTVLGDALEGLAVDIIPCFPRMAKLPVDQRCSIGSVGSRLGEDAFIGEELLDRTGKFRLMIGPVSGEQFRELLPAGHKHRLLTSLTGFYLSAPLDYDLEILIKEGEVQTAVLGGTQWAHLGWNTWVFSGDCAGEVRAIFQPQHG
jgi:type VI secretion system protein ImpH